MWVFIFRFAHTFVIILVKYYRIFKILDSFVNRIDGAPSQNIFLKL